MKKVKKDVVHKEHYQTLAEKAVKQRYNNQ